MTATTDNRELRAMLERWLIRYNELIQMDRTNEAEQVLRCINEGKRLLTRTEADEAECEFGGRHDWRGDNVCDRCGEPREKPEADEAATVGAVDRLCRWFWDNAMVTGDISGSPEDYREHAEKLLAFLGTHPQNASAGAIPEAVAVQPSGYMVGSGFVAKGDYVIPTAHGVRVVNAEFARGWNEARAAIAPLHQPAKGGAL